ncbi:MAG: DedA family protein [Dehalococcoidia bacterium]|nr:DedA family protein [Dehalococcoidia bacterium]
MPIIHLKSGIFPFFANPLATCYTCLNSFEELPLGAIENTILEWMRELYVKIGWPGVILLMAIESMSIPLPSELIMPFAGWFLIKDHGHGIAFVFLAAFYGTLGNLLGSWVGYAIGAAGGRPLVSKFGKYLLISIEDVDKAEGWFRKYGDHAILVSRMLPIVRTFISMPAGAARMDIRKFSIYTFIGSYPFVLALTFGGYVLGENWERLRNTFRVFDIPFAIVLVLLIVWFLRRHYRRAWRSKQNETPDKAG